MLGMKKNYKKSKLEQLTAFVYLIEEKSMTISAFLNASSIEFTSPPVSPCNSAD